MEKKPPLLILTGPTAVGKTALSIALAREVQGEIISADSMQVYRYMDIGSAKIRKEEMCGVPHYLIDCLNPEEEFNIYVFQQMAKKAMAQIYANGHVPIVVGGTGFYIQSLIYDILFEEEEDDGIRQKYEQLLTEKGEKYLHDLLEKVDTLIIGGAMSYTFFKAMGLNIGNSLVEEDKLELAKQLLAKAPVMSYAVSEYVFLQADSEQDAAQAVKILQTRIDSQADGDAFYPETIDQWKAAKVLQNGAYVAMIASGEHQTEIEDAWNAQFGA